METDVQDSYPERIHASYGEAFKALAQRYAPNNTEGRWRGGILPYIKRHPIRAAILTGASALAIGGSLYGWGLTMTAAQMLGIGGLVLSREAATFKNHRHIMATASLACVVGTAQQALMALSTGDPGSYVPGGILVAHAAATLSAFAIIPESRKNLRQAITWGGGVAGAAAAAYASYKYQSGLGLIPAATTLANSLLFSIKDGNTPRARAGYIGMNIAHLFYWATQPVMSLAPMAAEAMYLATHTTTLAENDIPVADRQTGKPFTARERLSAYFSHVIGQGRPPEDLGVTRKEQGWERPDNKAYADIGRAVLGS